jgi:hypothetical protein
MTTATKAPAPAASATEALPLRLDRACFFKADPAQPARLQIEATPDPEWVRRLAEQARARVQPVLDKVRAEWEDGPTRAKVVRLTADLDRVVKEGNAAHDRVMEASRVRQQVLDNTTVVEDVEAAEKALADANDVNTRLQQRARILREMLKRAREEDFLDLSGRIHMAAAKLREQALAEFRKHWAALAEALVGLFGPLNSAEYLAILCRHTDAKTLAREILPPEPAAATPAATIDYGPPLPVSQGGAGGRFWQPNL